MQMSNLKLHLVLHVPHPARLPMLLQHYEKHASLLRKLHQTILKNVISRHTLPVLCRSGGIQVAACEYLQRHRSNSGSRDCSMLMLTCGSTFNLQDPFALGSQCYLVAWSLWPQQTRSDQQLAFRPPDTCLSVGGRISNVWEPRGGRQSENWGWWDDAWPKCQIAALASNMTHCCCGWSDLLYLPAAMVMPFCKSAALFRDVWHEVAIPTILHALIGREQTAVTLAHCLGGCCENVPWSKARLAA